MLPVLPSHAQTDVKHRAQLVDNACEDFSQGWRQGDSSVSPTISIEPSIAGAWVIRLMATATISTGRFITPGSSERTAASKRAMASSLG